MGRMRMGGGEGYKLRFSDFEQGQPEITSDTYVMAVIEIRRLAVKA